MATNNRIHIFGAAGTGTTTLGKSLAKRLNIPHLDTDNYYWLQTEIPYTEKREIAQRIDLLKADLDKHPEWVLSGSLCGWGDFTIPMFSLVVFLWIPEELRMSRLKEREIGRFGQEALAPGGWFHENHTGFMEWAAQYDTGGTEMRSRTLHEEWMQTLPCRLVRFEQPLNVDIMTAQIKVYLKP
ncbi:MAG: AAA family ATPase [Dehalococcoidales bacterium]|nr:MAG: AAA family ATPase [Dehalococcoidales bacterium]